MGVFLSPWQHQELLWQISTSATTRISQIEERRLRLEEYLQQLVLQLNWSLEDSLRSFLECDEWLKPRKSKAEKTKNRERLALGP